MRPRARQRMDTATHRVELVGQTHEGTNIGTVEVALGVARTDEVVQPETTSKTLHKLLSFGCVPLKAGVLRRSSADSHGTNLDAAQFVVPSPTSADDCEDGLRPKRADEGVVAVGIHLGKSMSWAMKFDLKSSSR